MAGLQLLFLIVLGTGCGVESVSVDQGEAAALLIQESNLPSGSKAMEGIPDGSCDPLEVLKREDSETAKSSMFAIGRLRVQEAVGVFAEESQAVGAYEALSAGSRLDCVRKTIEFQNHSVTNGPWRDLDVGDEARSIGLRALSTETGRVTTIDIVSIRSGSTVASLIFISPTPRSPSAMVDDIVDSASGLL